jgi:peptide/nickel transport system substrate-binding protein
VNTPRPTAAKQVVPDVVVDADVNPGKVTLMTPAWGNERFDNIHYSDQNSAFAAWMGVHVVAGNEKGQLLPGLATSWDLSPDGYSWIFEFRDGVKFHNGEVADISDYLWSFKHNYSKECAEKCTALGQINLVGQIESIEQTGPVEITLTNDVIDASFVYQWLSEVGPAFHMMHLKRPLLYDKEQELAFDKDPVMGGQMSFVEHVIGERITMERFDDFYYQPAYGLPEDRRVKFQTLDLVLVPEEATRAAALRSGEADIATVSLATEEQVEAGGGKIVFGDQGVYWMVFFPHEYEVESPFNDKGVRQAMSYSIDKELMMEQLYGGPTVAVAKGWGPVTPNTIGYSTALDPFPYDPDKARELLADAGYPDGEGFGDVIINTWPSPTMPFLVESAQVAADFWKKELGLDVEVNVGDETSTKTAWLAGELAGQVLWRDNQARVDGAGITNLLYGNPTADLAFHNDPALFARVTEAMEVFDPATRGEALNELYVYLHDLSLEMAIGYVNIPWGLGPRIDNFEPWPLAFHPTGRHTLTLK